MPLPSVDGAGASVPTKQTRRTPLTQDIFVPLEKTTPPGAAAPTPSKPAAADAQNHPATGGRLDLPGWLLGSFIGGGVGPWFSKRGEGGKSTFFQLLRRQTDCQP